MFFQATNYQKLILLNNAFSETKWISIQDSNGDNFVKVIRCSIVFEKSCKRIAPGCSHNGLYIRKWEIVCRLVTSYFRLVTAIADAFEATYQAENRFRIVCYKFQFHNRHGPINLCLIKSFHGRYKILQVFYNKSPLKWMSNNFETLSVRANVNIDANFSEGPIYLSPFPFDLLNFCSQNYLLPVQFLLEMSLFYI